MPKKGVAVEQEQARDTNILVCAFNYGTVKPSTFTWIHIWFNSTDILFVFNSSMRSRFPVTFIFGHVIINVIIPSFSCYYASVRLCEATVAAGAVTRANFYWEKDVYYDSWSVSPMTLHQQLLVNLGSRSVVIRRNILKGTLSQQHCHPITFANWLSKSS
jgi:hypothetical protein